MQEVGNAGVAGCSGEEAGGNQQPLCPAEPVGLGQPDGGGLGRDLRRQVWGWCWASWEVGQAPSWLSCLSSTQPPPSHSDACRVPRFSLSHSCSVVLRH